MDDTEDEHDDRRSLAQNATDAFLFPLRVATSPPLLRTYLRTLLLLIASAVLFAFAVVAYTSFYYSYIPIRAISVPVYLQFDHGTTPASYLGEASRGFSREVQRWPYGVADVKELVDRQKYDVVVSMDVPRSRTNLRAGNWMVELSLRGPPVSASGGIKSILGWDGGATTESASSRNNTATATSRPSVLAHSCRPAILTYRSWPTEHLYRLIRLPLYLSGFGTESETLHISMLESAYFPTTVPSSLRLELRSHMPLEVYRVSVHISAKLEGLRWIMYKYRVSSVVIFVTLFWVTEMGMVLLTWGAVTMVFRSTTKQEDREDADGAVKVKKEIEDGASEARTEYSDTDRTFPTLSSQQPLRYRTPDDKTKTKTKEEHEDTRLGDVPTREEEADDEDDDFVLQEPVPRGLEAQGVFTDSGLGTGMDSERDRERERVRRRGSARGSGKVKDERDL